MNARERLFAAAKEIVERRGLNSLSIREVGRQAEMSAMAIYRHFPDKDALIDALMEDGLAAWEAIAGSIDSDDAIEWLRQLVEAYRDFALREPHRFDAAFLFPARKVRTFPNDIEAGRSPVINMMVARIEQAQANSRLSDAPATEIALMLAAMAQGLVSMQRAGRFSSAKEFHASYQRAMDHLLAGLMTDEAIVSSARKAIAGELK